MAPDLVDLMAPKVSEELLDAIAHGFSIGELRRLLYLRLGISLDVEVDTSGSLKDVVFNLLTYLEGRGTAVLMEFLRRAVEQKPNNVELKASFLAVFPGSFEIVPSERLVASARSGLQTLASIYEDPLIASAVNNFSEEFDFIHEQIHTMRKYKSLHESLHNLQLQLPALVDTLARIQCNRTLIRSLGLYAHDINWDSARARDKARQLPSATVELGWIDELSECLQIIKEISRNNPEGAELADICATVQRLKAILPESQRINNLLTLAAKSLKLNLFSSALNSILSQIQDGGRYNDVILQSMRGGAEAIAALGPRLDGLVAEHDEWQVLDRSLNVAEVSGNLPPAKRIPRWHSFKENLIGQCSQAPNEAWSIEMRESLTMWENLAGNLSRGNIESIEVENAFFVFRRQCLHRFFNVDSELNELCDQLSYVSTPLAAITALVH